jgi:hypothetical protein
MDFLTVTYEISGVTTSLLVPPLTAFVVAFISSTGGLSGAFLLLPIMISVMGFSGPSASATNFMYNVVAIPGGVYRFWREGRLFGALAQPLMIGTVPGILVGYYLRTTVLSDPETFKVFAACVLGAVGVKLVLESFSKKGANNSMTPGAKPEVISKGVNKTSFKFDGKAFSFNPAIVMVVAFVVGVIGGAYGIGGGVILIPFCVMAFGLPVYVVAGAGLLSTFMASVFGLGFYSLIPSGLPTGPDWLLGLSFGVGGLLGTYLGARAQRFMPEKLIKIILALLLLGITLKYLLGS